MAAAPLPPRGGLRQSSMRRQEHCKLQRREPPRIGLVPSVRQANSKVRTLGNGLDFVGLCLWDPWPLLGSCGPAIHGQIPQCFVLVH